MRSSYSINHYGEVLRGYVTTWRPTHLVELGILDGYSTLHIAQGMRELDKLSAYKGTFDAYDLFETYEFKHGNKEDVESMLKEKGVFEYVNIRTGNAYEVHRNYEDSSIDFLHIDISNTGKVIADLMSIWNPKIGEHGLILIEGGSEERDNVEWMKKYNMPSIKKEIESNPIIDEFYSHEIYPRFPSMTVLIKRGS